MRSLADISGAEEDSEDGQNDYYAGGAKSGQAGSPNLPPYLLTHTASVAALACQIVVPTAIKTALKSTGWHRHLDGIMREAAT